MSELRQNMMTGEWVVYAKERENRPYDFLRTLSTKENNSDHCPFCGGNEALTPWPILQDGTNGQWGIRVFNNRFPVVCKEGDEEEVASPNAFYQCISGLGRHEVLVDTPLHMQTIDQFTSAHLTDVLKTLQARGLSILNEGFTKYLQIFKNCGADAGMSLAHSHWQLVGLPVVPRRLLIWQNRSLDYEKTSGGCMLCHMLSNDLQEKSRIIYENAHFVALTPYAGRFPYEAHIVPNEHISSFTSLPLEQMKDLGEILLHLLKRLSELRNDIGFNICFMEEPKTSKPGLLHWHIEIYPRVGGFAGMEFATETYINSVMPEKAAKFYRHE